MNSSDEITSAAEPASVADRAAAGTADVELNTAAVVGMTIRKIYVAVIVIIPSIILNRKNNPFFTGTSASSAKI